MTEPRQTQAASSATVAPSRVSSLRPGLRPSPLPFRDRAVRVLILVYLVPMLAFGKAWAATPLASFVYFPDFVLLMCAALTIPDALQAIRQDRRVRNYSILVIILAVLVAQGVYRGVADSYPIAIKYATMGVYPVASIGIASWLRLHWCDVRAMPKFVLAAPAGVFACSAFGLEIIPSAAGLYLATAAAVAFAPDFAHRRLIAVTTIIAGGYLAAESSRRGALLTIVLAIVATVLATSSSRSKRAKGFVVGSGLIGTGLALVLLVTTSPTSWPVLGPTLRRLGESFASNNTSASNNVAIRNAFWRYALSTTEHQNPTLGVGAGHRIDVQFLTNNVSTQDIGVHNSYIGYAFYFGFPAGLIVVALFIWAARSAWRARRDSRFAPFLFGTIIAAIATALSNVALESPYIGGVSWLAVGAAFVLPRPVPTAQAISAAASDAGRVERNDRGSGTSKGHQGGRPGHEQNISSRGR